MFRIRKIHDRTTPVNRDAIRQVLDIFKVQFPDARPAEAERLPRQLEDPLSFRYRSVLLVAENADGRVRGFAMMLHLPDVAAVYLELISSAPGRTGGGVGGALYERVREDALVLGAHGLFFECSVDDPAVVGDPDLLRQNRARLRFYERYGARPIADTAYASPISPGDRDLYHLVYDDLGRGVPMGRAAVRRIVRAILERKYGDIIPKEQIDRVVASFRDDPIRLRPPTAPARAGRPAPALQPASKAVALVVNEGHEIHHVHDRGYVEAPVRIAGILAQIEPLGIFTRVPRRRAAERHLRAVHDRRFLDYFKRACASVEAGKSFYPIVFPLRNHLRPPVDLELRVGYYCMDVFTPLNANAYLAARGAVDCAVTAAEEILAGFPFAYALVRPPGHHAERSAFGGFCYFNHAAVAAHFLSAYGRVAVLDIDFHHGNGTQQIFYERDDVLTVSIHGDPRRAYPHFSGFADERGHGKGLGANLNLPLPEDAAPDRFRRTLATALKRIRRFGPAHLVLSLGLDTAKADPTGTWRLVAEDFREAGRLIGREDWPVLVVQEGGYRTRTLGANARAFFEGLWDGHGEWLRRRGR